MSTIGERRDCECSVYGSMNCECELAESIELADIVTGLDKFGQDGILYDLFNAIGNVGTSSGLKSRQVLLTSQFFPFSSPNV